MPDNEKINPKKADPKEVDMLLALAADVASGKLKIGEPSFSEQRKQEARQQQATNRQQQATNKTPNDQRVKNFWGFPVKPPPREEKPELGGDQWRDPSVIRKRKRAEKQAQKQTARESQRAQIRSEQRESRRTTTSTTRDQSPRPPRPDASLWKMLREVPKHEVRGETPKVKALNKGLIILLSGTGIITGLTLAAREIANKSLDRAEQNPPAPLTSPNYNEAGNQTVESVPINQMVTVFNTGGEGLKLRSGPGQSNEMIGSVFDGDTLVVVGEPVAADGYIWYPVQFPFSENETPFWAAGDWLTR